MKYEHKNHSKFLLMYHGYFQVEYPPHSLLRGWKLPPVKKPVVK